MTPETPDCFDVVIVGAGLSGIAAAYHLQTKCPGKSFVILEARERLGGTWDFFQYPGIRSDSDMYTLGFSFRPWRNPKAIADGPSILAYLKETAEAYGLGPKMRLRHRVVQARWSTDDGRWTLEVHDEARGRNLAIQCKFLFGCSGFYDYAAGYTPALAGRERFRGRVVHPQEWTDDIEYEGKRVVVIGSGATAVTLVPELAKRAAHVTMLQRSPTYIVSVPARDPMTAFVGKWLPERAGHSVMRWKNTLGATAFYDACRAFPGVARRLLIAQVGRGVGAGVDVATHFTPRYMPWDQRLCLVPDGDLFHAIKTGRADVVTDGIDTFTESGLRLRSGREIAADLVVTATGFQLKFLGGIALDVDGARVDPSQIVLYKGVMLSNIPNLAIAIGYTNASWTLKCELASEYVCRLLDMMDRAGHTWALPRMAGAETERQPLIDFSSSYVKRAKGQLPHQGAAPPWRLYQNYVRDLLLMRYAPIEDGVMEFGAHHARRSATSRERQGVAQGP
jgi:cation diffusion facilitator CzcD-associated flavoprotein CzcO